MRWFTKVFGFLCPEHDVIVSDIQILADKQMDKAGKVTPVWKIMVDNKQVGMLDARWTLVTSAKGPRSFVVNVSDKPRM